MALAVNISKLLRNVRISIFFLTQLFLCGQIEEIKISTYNILIQK